MNLQGQTCCNSVNLRRTCYTFTVDNVNTTFTFSDTSSNLQLSTAKQTPHTTTNPTRIDPAVMEQKEEALAYRIGGTLAFLESPESEQIEILATAMVIESFEPEIKSELTA